MKCYSINVWRAQESNHTASINGEIQYMHEHGVVFERSHICICGLRACLCFGLFTQKTPTTPLWISFLSYSVLEMSTYVATQSPSLCFFQILWRPQTLLLLFQLPWIPPARQLIGDNNKLGSFEPLTNLSPCWRSKRLPIPSLTSTHVCAHIHVDELGLTRAHSGIGCWQRNRDQCNLLQHNPKPLSSSI